MKNKSGWYLIDNPPARRQFDKTRKYGGKVWSPTGAIVLHTTESDAEPSNVAQYIAERKTAGSYHSIAGRNNYINLVPFESAAYGSANGVNHTALHFSFAAYAREWPEKISDLSINLFFEQALQAIGEMQTWLHNTHYITVPAKKLTLPEFRAGRPGFIGHEDLDPGRRTDPGITFPWVSWLRHWETRNTSKDLLRIISDGIDPNLLVSLMYRSALGREAEPAGLAYWVDHIRRFGLKDAWFGISNSKEAKAFNSN